MRWSNAAALAVVVGASAATLDAQAAPAASTYVPGTTWERRAPGAVGMDAALLDSAIAFHRANEAGGARDMEENHYRTFGRQEPFGQGIGPFKPRGDPTGIVIRRGYVVAVWGEPDRVDMTHSVTKSFLSSVAGLAYDRGMIRDVRDTVRGYMAPIYPLRTTPATDRADKIGESMMIDLFETPHNRRITWDDLLRQVSDWEGTLWGKPDWADRPASNVATWRTRERVAPGTVYEYNDVRVNVLALALTNIWRRPLPQVLKQELMDPIGASNTWRWFGYDNSWITLDGQPVQSVSGGGHWGGGMFINASDMAWLALLTLRRGKWGTKQLLSDKWVTMALTPTPAQKTYGFMNWFLNTDRAWKRDAPATAFGHVGNGTNLVYVDPENDIVAVVRWIGGNDNEFLKRLLASVKK